MSAKYSFESEFDFKRCWDCGRHYAVEIGFQKHSPSCPFCTAGKVSQKEKENEKLRRGMTAIRAYLKRIRK